MCVRVLDHCGSRPLTFGPCTHPIWDCGAPAWLRGSSLPLPRHGHGHGLRLRHGRSVKTCCSEGEREREVLNESENELRVSILPFDFSSDVSAIDGERGLESDVGFVRLPARCPWSLFEMGSTLLVYECLVHVPFGIGGLSILSSVLHQKSLDPFTQGLGLFISANIEVAGCLFFLHDCLKSYKPFPAGWFRVNSSDLSGPRGLPRTVAIGLLSTLIAAGVGQEIQSHFMMMEAFPDEAVSSSALQEVLSGDGWTKLFIFFSYVVVAPALEETVYRGFLLTSLCFSVPWPLALLLSSLVFSLCHFSVESFLQLFLVGCTLSAAHLWSGNLLAPILIHSIFNTLVVAGKLL